MTVDPYQTTEDSFSQFGAGDVSTTASILPNSHTSMWTPSHSSYYILSSSLCIPLCLYVISTYLRKKKFQSPQTSINYGRSVANLLFATFILIYIGLNKITDGNSHICLYIGTFSILFYFASIAYFIGVCYAITMTLARPLMSVHRISKTIHFWVWTLSIATIVVFEISVNGGGQSQCFFEGEVGQWMILTIAIPQCIGLILGLSSTAFAYLRLRDGAMKKMGIQLVREHVLLLIGFIITSSAWIVLMFASVIHNLDSFYTNQFSKFLSVIILCNGIIDAVTWRFTMRKYDQQTATTIFTNQAFMRLLSSGSKIKNMQSPTSSPGPTGADSSEEEINMLMDEQQEAKREQFKIEQNISDALRKTIVQHIMEGIEQAVERAQAQQLPNVALHDITPELFPPRLHDKNLLSQGKSVNHFNVKITEYDESTYRSSVSTITDKIETDVQFIDYAPHAFGALRRETYGITDEEYLLSIQMNAEDVANWIKQCKFSEGKSGAFFIFTKDRKFLIKSVRDYDEAPTLLRMLSPYYDHMSRHPRTFINRFLGYHGMTIYGTTLYFVVMQNIYPPDVSPHENYDLKGSWVRRITNKHIEGGELLKDGDFRKQMLLTGHDSMRVWRQLKADTQFLGDVNVMDYSLILGIYYVGIDSSNLHKFSTSWHLQPQTATAFQEAWRKYNAPPMQEASKLRLDISEISKNQNSEMATPEPSSPTEYFSPLSTSMQAENEDMVTSLLTPARPLTIPKHSTGGASFKRMKHNNNDGQNNPKGSFHSSQVSMDEDLELSKMSVDYLAKTTKKFDIKKRPVGFKSGDGTIRQLEDHPNSLLVSTIEGPGFYCMGIVDFLQPWNFWKRFERLYKVYLFCNDGDGISCIEPYMYRSRFLAKLLEIGIGRKISRYTQ